MRHLIVVLSCLAATPAAPALGQGWPITVSVFGGATVPAFGTRQAIGLGWNAGAAVSTAREGVGVRVEYLFSKFAAEDATFDVTLGPMLPAFQEVTVRGKSQVHTGSLDVTWSRGSRDGRRTYIMAGPTLFHRRAQLTGTGPFGTTSTCEAAWMQCSAQPIPFDRALGIRKSDDLGFNVGAGFAFQPGGLAAQITIEARYFYTWGRKFLAADGRSVRSSAQFVPISVGLTF